MYPIENLLYGRFFNNTLFQYLIFLALISGSILIGKTVYFFSKTILRKLATKTKSSFDNLVLEVIEKPLVFFIVLIGFYIGYKQLTLTQETESIFHIITKSLITITLAWFAIRLLERVIDYYLTPLAARTETDLDDHLIPLLKKLGKYSLMIITVLILLSNIGVNVTSAIAGLGLGGLAFALAAQETLKNILGGLSILTDKPFKLGDWVEIDKYQGEVVEIGLRSTRLKTTTGEYVTIPNNIIASTSVVNFLKFSTKKITFIISLSPLTTADKIEKAKAIIIEILENTQKVTKESIEIYFSKFSTYSLDLDIRFDVSSNQGKIINSIKDSVNLKIRKEFAKEEIQLAFTTPVPDRKI